MNPDWPNKIKPLLISGSVFDICSGNGRFYTVFEGHPYTGIDKDPNAINSGIKQFPESEWICQDINDFKWRDFDNVFSWVGLQHVKNPPFDKIRKHAKNAIFCEIVKDIESTYQFSHDWKKEFPGIRMLGSMVGIEGIAVLMHWRKDGLYEMR